MQLTSTAFVENGKIPCTHVASFCGGGQTSPPLAWTAGPVGTQSYALVMRDVTVANVHWVLYDIPADVTAVDAVARVYQPNPPAGAKQSQPPASFGDSTYGWFGPCPIAGTAQHTYSFTLYARATATLAGVSQNTSGANLAALVADGALASSVLNGTQDAKQNTCSN